MKINIETKDAKFRIEDNDIKNCVLMFNHIMGVEKFELEPVKATNVSLPKSTDKMGTTTSVKTTPVSNPLAYKKPTKIEAPKVTLDSNRSILSAYETGSLKTEQPKPFVKKDDKVEKVVAYKCNDCGKTHVSYLDPSKPVKCPTCGFVKSLDPLVRANYKCVCGKICYFMQEEQVSAVKCHSCNNEHLMVFDSEENHYKSLNSIQ